MLRGVWREVRRPAVAVCFVVIFSFNMFLTASEAVVVPVTQHASKLHFSPLQNSYVYAGVAVWIMVISISIMVRLQLAPPGALARRTMENRDECSLTYATKPHAQRSAGGRESLTEIGASYTCESPNVQYSQTASRNQNLMNDDCCYIVIHSPCPPARLVRALASWVCLVFRSVCAVLLSALCSSTVLPQRCSRGRGC